MSGYTPKRTNSNAEKSEAKASALQNKTRFSKVEKQQGVPAVQGGLLAASEVAPNETVDTEAAATVAKLRRRRRWPPIIGIIITLTIVSGAVTYYILSAQVQEREERRTAGYELLDEAIALIQESDQTVISIDTATVTEVTKVNLSERQVLLERVPTALETLASAEEKAREAVETFMSEEDKEFAQQVVDAVSNRTDMLESGEVIITKDIEAMNATLLFGQAWELIVNADTELRSVTELSKTGAYNQLIEAIQRNKAIITSLQSASQLLVQAQEMFDEADFSLITQYITLKEESVQLAIEADQAILDGDIETVNIKNTEFGLKDTAVVKAANMIPSEPITLITSAYETATAEAQALYRSARANAAEADETIREYVGVEMQTEVQ